MKKIILLALFIWLCIPITYADMTVEQSEDLRYFIETFIEMVNARRDERGYPLFVYALGPKISDSKEIRTKGYAGELYNVEKNYYHIHNGKTVNLGPKWCMDCATFVSYIYKTTLNMDLRIEGSEEPWHVRDYYMDAYKEKKYGTGKYFKYVYKDIKIQNIDMKLLQPGDMIIWMGKEENHGMLYLGNGEIAHAIDSLIKYNSNPVVLGLGKIKLRKYYLDNTILSVVRIKDDVVSPDEKINMKFIWPDTNEEENFSKEVAELEEIGWEFMNIKGMKQRLIYCILNTEF